MAMMPVKVVTVAQMQALEDASERAGVSRDALMENAGLACARRIRNRLGGAAGRGVVILTGPGNNGADGLVVARHLRRWGAEVWCYVVGGRPDVDLKMDAVLGAGVAVMDAGADLNLAGLDALLSRCDVVVDAILGAGRYRPPAGVIAAVIGLVNRRRRDRRRRGWGIIALDLPTGAHPDTAAVAADSIVADETLALGSVKWGIAGFPGAGIAGRISVVDIGLPPAVIGAAGLTADWMTPGLAAALLPARPLDGHKGTFGHLLVVAGSRHYIGAAALACRAAHRAGAGLVTLAAPASIHPILAGKLDETIHLPLPDDADGRIAAAAAAVIRERMGAYSALAVGCGMGQSDGAADFMRRLLLYDPGGEVDNRVRSLPAVIDADGLNNLARCDGWPDLLGVSAVLTPHPGEMATLTGQATAAIQGDRPAVASRYAAAWGQTVLLKGAHSIVSAPGGSDRPDGRQRILPFANPALAAGGTGDVLTGIIGSLLAQGLAPPDAAALGGYLHGAAGELARRAMGAAGVIASDLPDLLPGLMRDLRAGNWPTEDWGDGGFY